MWIVGLFFITLWCSYHVIHTKSQTPVVPNSYTLNKEALSRNGSLATGNCINFSNSDQTCNSPKGSVLFDGVIPSVLNISTHNNWASQLLAIETDNDVNFNFVNNESWLSFEIIMFNCREKDIGAIWIETRNGNSTQTCVVSLQSCTNLIKVCCYNASLVHSKVLTLNFNRIVGSHKYIYLGEVTFYSSHSLHCTPDVVMATFSSEIITTNTSTVRPGETITTNTSTVRPGETITTNISTVRPGETITTNTSTVRPDMQSYFEQLANTISVISSSEKSSTNYITVIISAVLVCLLFTITGFTLLSLVIIIIICQKRNKKNNTSDKQISYCINSKNAVENQNTTTIEVQKEVLETDVYAVVNKKGNAKKIDKVNLSIHQDIEHKNKNEMPNPLDALVDKSVKRQNENNESLELYSCVNKSKKEKNDEENDNMDVSQMYAVVHKNMKDKNSSEALLECNTSVDESEMNPCEENNNVDVSQMYAVVDIMKKKKFKMK